MKKKKISVIVPCYKVEKYLPRCLDSLVNQTLEEIEIICINDGSPDNCIKILRDYEKKYPDKIVIIDKKNEGVWRGRKDGIKIATGEFISFVDSDDYVSLEWAEKLYDAAKSKNADISVCGFDRIDMDTGKLYSREMCKSEKTVIDLEKNPEDVLMINGAPWNKIYKAHLLKDMAELEHPPKILDDMMFLLLIYINAKKIVFIPDSLVYYMVRTDSIINTIKEEKVDSTYQAMLEVRRIYEQSENRARMLPVLDGMAFLHLGVSLMFRLSNDPECDLKKAIKRNNKFLDDYFPTWRHLKYLKLSYMVKHGFGNFKILIMKNIYKLHMFRIFLKIYNFMISKLKIDIKW